MTESAPPKGESVETGFQCFIKEAFAVTDDNRLIQEEEEDLRRAFVAGITWFLSELHRLPNPVAVAWADDRTREIREYINQLKKEEEEPQSDERTKD